MRDFSVELKQAGECFTQNRLDRAEQIVQSILKASPDNTDALNIYGSILLTRGNARADYQVFSRVSQLAPGNSAAQFNLGRCCQMMGDFPGAISAFEASVRAEPGNLPAWAMLARGYQNQDRLDDCIDANSQILRLAAPQSNTVGLRVDAHLGIGTAHVKAGNFAEAKTALKLAVQLSPNDPRGHSTLGDAYRNEGNNSKAVQCFLAAVKLHPRSVMYRLNAATAHMCEGELEAADALIRECLKDAPEDKRLISAHGALLWEMGRNDEYWKLFDHETFVSPRTLDTPPTGFATMDDFHVSLIEEIRCHPTLAGERATKSTKGGLQTGNIFASSPPPATAALMGLINEQIAQYVAEPSHCTGVPGTAWSESWTLIGWGVVLHAHGYQTAHNHPSGMVSGVYYIQVPDEINDSGLAPGCIEFGPPNDKFGVKREPPSHLVRPNTGCMCLFPSHYWHRTIPFESADERICIAFDAVPVG